MGGRRQNEKTRSHAIAAAPLLHATTITTSSKSEAALDQKTSLARFLGSPNWTGIPLHFIPNVYQM